jgi:hypothetical protein
VKFYTSYDPHLTTLLSCHISGHKEYSPDDLMTANGDNLDNFSMDSTHIVSTCDMAYFAAGVKKPNYNMLDSLYIRPHSRRAVICLNPFSTKFIEENGTISWGKIEELNYSDYLSEDATRLLNSFIWNCESSSFTIKDLLKINEQYLKEDDLRKYCKELEEKGYIRFGKFGEYGSKYYQRKGM